MEDLPEYDENNSETSEKVNLEEISALDAEYRLLHTQHTINEINEMYRMKKSDRTEMNWIRRFVDKGEDPPMLFLFLIACLFLGSGYLLTTMHNDKFDKNIAVIIEKNADWEFVEKDAGGCDFEGNNCNKRTSINCLADIVVQHNVEGVNYTSQVNNWFVYSEWDHSNAEQDCEEFVKNSILDIGSNMTIFFDKEDPSVAYASVPETWLTSIYLFGMCFSVFWVFMAILFVLQKCFPRVFTS